MTADCPVCGARCSTVDSVHVWRRGLLHRFVCICGEWFFIRDYAKPQTVIANRDPNPPIEYRS